MSFGENVNTGQFIQKTTLGTTVIHSKLANQHQQVNTRETYEKQLKTEFRSFYQRGRPTYHRDRPASLTCRSVGL
jgi:hypothetical protein